MRLSITLLTLAPIGVVFGAATYNPNEFGGSPTPIGAGARSLGMGGAFVAIADDATANTWNPAGMTQLERPEASFTLGYSQRRTRSDSTSDSRDDAGVDHLSLVLPFHRGCQQTIGLAWQRQFDFTKGIAFSSAESDTVVTETRSYEIDQEGSFATLGLSYAIEPLPGLSFGATLFDWDDDHTFGSTYQKRYRSQTTAIFDFGIGPQQRVQTTTDTDNDVSVARGLSTVLGVWWQANPRLTLGLNIKPRYDLHLRNQEQTTNAEVDEDLTTTPPTVNSSSTASTSETKESVLTYPTSATLGAAIRFGDLTTLSLDATWTKWDQFSSSSGGTTRSPLASAIQPSDYHDGLTARVGFERIIPFERFMVVPRVGALYEETPGVTTSPSVLDPANVQARMDRYYGFTLGTSVFREALIVDAAIQLRIASGIAGEGASPNETTTVHALAARISLAYLF